MALTKLQQFAKDNGQIDYARLNGQDLDKHVILDSLMRIMSNLSDLQDGCMHKTAVNMKCNGLKRYIDELRDTVKATDLRTH